MHPHKSWLRQFTLLSLTMLTALLAGCSSDSSSNLDNNEALRIYTLEAVSGSFAAAAGDTTGTKFQLNLKNQYREDDQILYFTNRGAVASGLDTLGNLIKNVWPRVYGAVPPSAILKATVNNLPVTLICILDKPDLNTTADNLSFSITYLDGQKPDASMLLKDVDITVTNNVAAGKSVWSHQLEADAATFEPVKNADGTTVDNTYTFRIQKTIGDAIGLTCAPQRKSESILVKDYLASWNSRFGSVPPNAVIYYQDSNGQWGGMQTVTLSNPVYDEKSGSISFTAKVLYAPWGPIGKTGLTVANPTIFIDGGSIVAYTLKNTTDKDIYVYNFSYIPLKSAQPATLSAHKSMQLILVPDVSMRVYFANSRLANTIEKGKAPNPFNYYDDGSVLYSFMEYKYEPVESRYIVDLSYLDDFSYPLTIKFSDLPVSYTACEPDFEYGFTSLSKVKENLKKQTDYRWDALIWPAVVDTVWDSEKYPKNMDRIIGPNTVWPAVKGKGNWVPQTYYTFYASLPMDENQLFGSVTNWNGWQNMTQANNPGPSYSGYAKALQQAAKADKKGKYGFFTYPQDNTSAEFTNVPDSTTTTITVYPYDK